jgi:uncharacterized RDD family membrane protein YckC
MTPNKADTTQRLHRDVPLAPAMRQVTYVGFTPRALAWTLDKLLFLALAALMTRLWPVEGLGWHVFSNCGADLICLEARWPLLLDALIRWFAPALITVLFLTRLRATPGKLVLQAEVVDAYSGATLSTRQAWIRVFACFLSYLTCGYGHLMVIFDQRKQALHDKCAGTVVIYKTKAANPRTEPD